MKYNKKIMALFTIMPLLFSYINIYANGDKKTDFFIKDTGHQGNQEYIEIQKKKDDKMRKLLDKYKSMSVRISDDGNSVFTNNPSQNGIDLLNNNTESVPQKLKDMYKDQAECIWNSENRKKSREDPLQSKFNIVTSKSILTEQQWLDYIDLRAKQNKNDFSQLKITNSKKIVGGCFEASKLVEHPINPDFCIGMGFHESGWGTSPIYKNSGNAFGWEAYNEDPAGNARKFGSDVEGSKVMMEGIWKNKLSPDGTYHHKELGTTMLQVSFSYAYNDKGKGYCGGGKPSDTWANSIAGVIRTAASYMNVSIPKLNLGKKD